MARTMLMHASLRYPEDTFSTDLWQMAMDYAVWFYNRTLSAIEIWSRSRFEPVAETLSNCHVWGFPTYVLETKLQKPGVKFLSGLLGVEEGLIWVSSRCIQHKLDWS